jgi:hypothetical protein
MLPPHLSYSDWAYTARPHVGRAAGALSHASEFMQSWTIPKHGQRFRKLAFHQDDDYDQHAYAYAYDH